MEINIHPYELTQALIAYLKSQVAYNEAAVQRMAYETEIQKERQAMMDMVKKELSGGSGGVNLGDLLDPSNDDEGTP